MSPSLMRSGSRGPTAAETVAALKAGMGALDLPSMAAGGAGPRSGGSLIGGRPPMAPWSQASISPQFARFEQDEEPQEILGGWKKPHSSLTVLGSPSPPMWSNKCIHYTLSSHPLPLKKICPVKYVNCLPKTMQLVVLAANIRTHNLNLFLNWLLPNTHLLVITVSCPSDPRRNDDLPPRPTTSRGRPSSSYNINSDTGGAQDHTAAADVPPPSMILGGSGAEVRVGTRSSSQPAIVPTRVFVFLLLSYEE